MKLNNRSLRIAITIALATWVWFHSNLIQYSLWIVIGWMCAMWIVSRPVFDFEYQVRIPKDSWALIFALAGAFLIVIGALGFAIPNQLLMWVGVAILLIGTIGQNLWNKG